MGISLPSLQKRSTVHLQKYKSCGGEHSTAGNLWATSWTSVPQPRVVLSAPTSEMPWGPVWALWVAVGQLPIEAELGPTHVPHWAASHEESHLQSSDLGVARQESVSSWSWLSIV